jgi:hypothetical protein
MRAGKNFLLHKFSTIPLTTFARSLRSWNDKNHAFVFYTNQPISKVAAQRATVYALRNVVTLYCVQTSTDLMVNSILP